ncbi:hypothetical protein Tco_0444821 [Tanacetum coccineum]
MPRILIPLRPILGVLHAPSTFAPLPDSDSAAPLILHNADELYDSSTSCWNPPRRNESALVEPAPVVVEADSLAIEVDRFLNLLKKDCM